MKSDDISNIQFPKITKSEDGRFKSSDELLIVQGIQYFEGDIKATADAFGLTVDDVSKIYLKYMQHIDKGIRKGLNCAKLDRALNKSIDIMTDHINALRAQQLTSKTKMLSTAAMASFSKILNTMVTLRNSALEEWNSQQAFTDRLIKMKSLESIECGSIQQDDEYSKNQESLINMLKETGGARNMGITGKTGKRGLGMRLTNTTTDQVYEFETIKEAGDFVGISNAYNLCRYSKDNSLFRGIWKVEYI